MASIVSLHLIFLLTAWHCDQHRSTTLLLSPSCRHHRKNFNLMSAELLQKHFCCPRNESVVIKISWHTSNTVQQPKECKHNKISHNPKMNIAHHQTIFGQLIVFKGYSFKIQWKKLTSVALQTPSTSDLQLFYKMSKDVLLES